MFGDWSVASQVGLMPRVQTTGDTGLAASTDRVAVSDGDRFGLFSPSNPLLWFGIFLAVTVGAAGAAGSVRLGKVKLSASAGK
jgi:hypothetical protein